MFRTTYIILICLLCTPLCAQEADLVISDILESLLDIDGGEEVSEDDYAEIYDQLCSMASSPQNINDQTLDDLIRIPLLSEHQAEEILNYRALYGDIKNMVELSLIRSIMPETRRLLQAIFYAAPSTQSDIKVIQRNSLNNILGNGTSTLVATFNLPFYKREGYTRQIKAGGYHGPTNSHSIRYRYKTRKLHIALTAAQDAGEPFFKGANAKGWDFYTGYVKYSDTDRHTQGSSKGLTLKDLIVGHYQLKAGMGLILNNTYRLSKSMIAEGGSIGNASPIIRGHSSKQESNYFQGICTQLQFTPQLNLTTFLSWRKIDATINTDEDNGKSISTIQTSGYHRTDNEIDRRDTGKEFTLGAMLSFVHRPIRISLNYLHTEITPYLLPSQNQIYNYYRARGSVFNNVSLSYSYSSGRFQFNGETAPYMAPSKPYHADDGTRRLSIATNNAMVWRATEQTTLTAIHRYYNYRFVSIFGSSFGDIRYTQNESGLLLGISNNSLRHLTISSYIDIAYHPWARYGYYIVQEKENGSSAENNYKVHSRSWEHNTIATLTKKRWSLSIRYRYREVAADESVNAMPAYSNSLIGTGQHTLRAKYKYNSGKFWNTTQLQGTCLTGTKGNNSKGWMIGNTCGLGIANNSNTTISAGAAYFSTSDYASRLYLMEPTIRYGNSYTGLYDHGFHIAAIAKTVILNGLSLSTQLTWTHFFNRDYISSGTQKINGHNQAGIAIQMEWKF